jgi:hypothetical protein
MAPVGPGLPPAGSTVNANAVGSTPAGLGITASSRPAASGVTMAALTGGPAVTNQS